MGAVFLGYDPVQDRQVALKVLADHLAADRSYIDRFYHEARTGSALNHANVVRTFSAGRDPATGRHFQVQEYVDGPNCQFLLDRTGPLAVADAVCVARGVACGLEYLHARRLVHRDVKPDNVLLTTSGVAKLADLGLVKRLDEDAGGLTAHDQGFGTSWYMPYEQALNARFVDARSDLFALGATLYHLLTGTVPFAGENHKEVTARKERGQYVPAGELNGSVPKQLDRILARLLVRNPNRRYQSASELIVAIDRSGIAAAVPSFVDLDLALQDPAARARLVSANQPTRPDLRADDATPIPPPSVAASDPTPLPSPVGHWRVRFRDKKGDWLTRRATTEQILQALQANRCPVDAQAARAGGKHFRPLRAYPEFQAVAPEPVAAEPTPPPVKRLSRCKYWQVVLSAGFGFGVLAAASMAALWRILAQL
jgi:serine/threonine-protein kinase